MAKNINYNAWEDIEEKKTPEGYVGVRDAFKKAGLDDSQLGWSNGQVTYKGVTYKPDAVGDGITYGTKAGVNDFITRAYNADGEEVVQINKYRDPSGLYDVNWNDATKEVLIGGKSVPYIYDDGNGNTFATKSTVENAYKDLAGRVGVKNPTQIYRQYESGIYDILDRIEEENDKKFTFDSSDLESDVVWNAYKNMYNREGQRAYEDSMAKVAARTGGNMSSMAQAAADAAYAYYNQQLTDKVPEIASDAYARWLDSKNQNLDTLYKRADALGALYGEEYGASNDALARYQAQQEQERQRKYDKLDYDVAKSDAEAQIAENAYNAAEMYDVPVPGELAAKYGVTPNADGTYPTPNQIYARKMSEIWENYQKGVYDYEAASELAAFEKQQGISLANELALYAGKLRMK